MDNPKLQTIKNCERYENRVNVTLNSLAVNQIRITHEDIPLDVSRRPTKHDRMEPIPLSLSEIRRTRLSLSPDRSTREAVTLVPVS